MVSADREPEDGAPEGKAPFPEPPTWEFQRPQKPPAPSLGPLIDFALFRQAGLAISLGIVLVVAPALGYFVGRWLAGTTGEPAWIAAGTGLGMVIGVLMVLRLLRLLMRNGS